MGKFSRGTEKAVLNHPSDGGDDGLWTCTVRQPSSALQMSIP
jgi:hypothetical protein